MYCRTAAAVPGARRLALVNFVTACWGVERSTVSTTLASGDARSVAVWPKITRPPPIPLALLPQVTVFRCRRCRTTFYCSRTHQRRHWARHRGECEEGKGGPPPPLARLVLPPPPRPSPQPVRPQAKVLLCRPRVHTVCILVVGSRFTRSGALSRSTLRLFRGSRFSRRKVRPG